MQEVTQLVGSLGFPIVMCLLVWYNSTKEQKALREVIEKNTQMMGDFKDALEGLKEYIQGKE